MTLEESLWGIRRRKEFWRWKPKSWNVTSIALMLKTISWFFLIRKKQNKLNQHFGLLACQCNIHYDGAKLLNAKVGFIESGAGRVTSCVIKLSVVLHRASVPCVDQQIWLVCLLILSAWWWGDGLSHKVPQDLGRFPRAPHFEPDSILAPTVRGGDISRKMPSDWATHACL